MAAGGKLYAPRNMTLLLQNERLPSSSDSLWPHSSFPGSNRGFMVEKEEEEEYEACFHPQGKKRRLTSEQVQFLEKNFEVENKLEPERKIQLGKELGLHPRQVAIWFQNRRARFKTKQLEKDYAALKSTFDNLKSDYDALLTDNHNLKQQMNSLLKNREKQKDEEEEAVNSSDFSEEHRSNSVVPMPMCKREEANSAKSDVVDSEDGGGWSLMEPADSSSEDEDRDLLTTLPCFPKVDYHDPSSESDHTNSSNHFAFPSVEDHTFCFWPYS